MGTEKRADFDIGNGVISFSVTVGSRRKEGRKEESLMKRTAKAGEEAKNVKQARLKGEEEDMTQSLTENQPSAREIAAAKAARARLYSKAQGQVSRFDGQHNCGMCGTLLLIKLHKCSPVLSCIILSVKASSKSLFYR